MLVCGEELSLTWSKCDKKTITLSPGSNFPIAEVIRILVFRYVEKEKVDE